MSRKSTSSIFIGVPIAVTASIIILADFIRFACLLAEDYFSVLLPCWHCVEPQICNSLN
jgi:hypothetical protein